MQRPQSNWTILIGFIVSIVTHLAVLLPMLISFVTSRAETRTVVGRFEPEHFRSEPVPPEDNEVKLGIERGSPSTLTWIGYEQYEEHLALLAETEQAAFTDEPLASEGVSLTSPTEAQPQTEPQPEPPMEAPETPQEQEPTPEAEDAPDELKAEEPPTAEPASADEVPSDPRNPVEQTTAPLLLDAANIVMPQAVLAEVEDAAQQALEAEQKIESDKQGEVGRQKPNRAEQQPQPRPRQQPAQEPVPEQPPPNVPGSPQPGDQADKDADATSTVDVPLDKIKKGKPVAAAGLELKPQRPAFTPLLMLTAGPGNPLCEMHFDGTGKVQRAAILRTSGDTRIDDAILASLYRWRAKGKPLESLAGTQTMPIRIVIVLNARAAARKK